MQPDACEPEEHSCRDLRLRCEPQRLLAWWAKLVHRVLVQEAMKGAWENQGERQDTGAAPEAAGLCLRPSVDSDAGLCAHRVHGAAIRPGWTCLRAGFGGKSSWRGWR